MIELTFITSNAAKAEQLSRHLDHPVVHKKLDLSEIQSLDLHEIIEHKAKEAYSQIGSTVLVEDTSLTFKVLGRLPGPLIKWFLGELNNAGLCALLDGYEDRAAVAECMFGLYDGVTLRVFEGSATGTISAIPKGERGFGWDPIFVPEGYTKTWGEMDTEEQKNTSMRRIALKKLEAHLKLQSETSQ
jgi:non-canonical purine NTP pyrophosphatase (RdgB/HAM1 family)